MRVELQIDPDCSDPHASLHITKLTSAIQSVIELLEKENEQAVFTAVHEGKIFIIDPEMIEIIRTEGRSLVLYDKLQKKYLLNKPLYEIQRQLGKNFIRISKSAIINFRRISHVEASFNGNMEIVMKNGIEEVITRSYKQQLKERLGV